jgi:hypothetical protein
MAMRWPVMMLMPVMGMPVMMLMPVIGVLVGGVLVVGVCRCRRAALTVDPA